MDKPMSEKEVKRAQVLDKLNEGKISQQQAAKQMCITPRYVRRLANRYQPEGVAGLVSKKRGIASNRWLNETIRATAIELIGLHYRDFGSTLASEKLAELHGIGLTVESVRQMMMQVVYGIPRRGGTVCAHPMCERRARFGELIQTNGSPHDWFEGRSPYCMLLVFIDDAIGRLTQLRFIPTETTLSYMQVLHDLILMYRLPAALDSDKHSIFRINAKDADPEAETQFSRAVRELGIECIHAHSPQAKGRVGRANQTLQDRLVKEMRLAGINDMNRANAWLPSYIANYNRRFAVKPKDTTDAHLTYPDTPAALVIILSAQVTKTLFNIHSCQHENMLLQVAITGTGLDLRGTKVKVHEHFDGNRKLLWKKRKLIYSVMNKP